MSVPPDGGAPPRGGTPGEPQLLEYRVDREVFEKRAPVEPGAAYPDRGAAAQIFVLDDFCELETLGPLREVEPGGSATHDETWTLREVER